MEIKRYFRHPAGHTVELLENEVAAFQRAMRTHYKKEAEEIEPPAPEATEGGLGESNPVPETTETDGSSQTQGPETTEGGSSAPAPEAAEATPEPTPEAAEPKPITSMTKAELEAKAAELGVDISSAANNGERVAAIQAKLEEMAKAN